MDISTTVGCVILVAAVSSLVALVEWSRRIIELISKKGLHSARDIQRDLQNGG